MKVPGMRTSTFKIIQNIKTQVKIDISWKTKTKTFSKTHSLVKKRVYGPRKSIFFYLYGNAQYSLKFPVRFVPTPTFPAHLRHNDVISAKGD